MPPLTRWFLKSAIVYLLVALLLALAMALQTLLPLPAVIGRMNPVYFHLFLVGWVTQMIFGVIYWMFPIITRDRPRGDARLAWSSYILLNVGLLLRVVGEPLTGAVDIPGFGWLLVASALLQWLGVVAFLIIAWPRVKGKYRGE